MAIKRFFREDLIKRVIATEVRLCIIAGLATIEPPIGPTVSQFGIIASDFCNDFNILSSNYLEGSSFLTVNVKKHLSDFFINFQGAKSSSLLKSLGFSKTAKRRRFFFFLSDLIYVAKFKIFELTNRLNDSFSINLAGFTNSIFGTASTQKCTFFFLMTSRISNLKLRYKLKKPVAFGGTHTLLSNSRIGSWKFLLQGISKLSKFRERIFSFYLLTSSNFMIPFRREPFDIFPTLSSNFNLIFFDFFSLNFFF